MSNPHANHQGEPGDTGTGVLRSQDDLRAAYDAGFEASGEGWNGEYPAGVMEDAGYKMRRAQWIAHFILEAPMPADGGLHADPGHIPMPRNADEAKAMWLLGEHWVRANAPELIASAPSPDPAGAGGDLGELERLSKAAAKLIAKWDGAPELPEEMEQALSQFEDAWAWADEFLSNRSGKLVASTGSGEETSLDKVPEKYRAKVAEMLSWSDEDWTLLKAYFPDKIERFRKTLMGAPASPSGHSRAEPSGLGASPECPSRGPEAPGVLWSAWSETDADSDPSDPGVTYCTEWFVGRWPIGAEEPDCRILIGTSRSAEIIARRVAEKLTSILNTDRIRLGSSGWRADCFRTRMSGFDAAYKKASESSQPQDWMTAALLAQQFRNVAYAVLIGDAPRQEPPASAGWVLVPRELPDAMVQAGGSMLPPTHRLTDCYDYFREAWAAALDARPIPPGALAGEAQSAETQSGSVEDEHAARRATPEATPQQSPSPTTETDPPMSVEEAREVLRRVPAHVDPTAHAVTLRSAAAALRYDEALRRAYVDNASRIEAALAALAPSDAPSTTESDR